MRIAISLLVALTPTAFAQEQTLSVDLADEAELHFRRGVEAYSQGDFQLALERMLRSNRLVPNKNVVFNIARIYEALRDYNEAYRSYAQFLSVEEDEQRKERAREAMRKLEKRVALVEIVSDPEGANVFIDRRDLGARGITPLVLALEPGQHKVIVGREGYRGIEADIDAKLGQTSKVEGTLEQIVGRLKVSGDEGVSVHFDSPDTEPLCVVPCDREIPIGQRVLVLTKEGFRNQTQLVSLENEGDSVQVEASLERVTGTIKIDSNVDGALVVVDDQPVGYTPLIVPVSTGKRTIRVESEGYEPEELDAQVLDGKTIELGTVRLQPRQLVVTASRVAEDLLTAPSSISVVSEQEIDAFGYPTLTEALRGTRGLTAINADHDSLVMSRGVGTASNRGTQTKTLLNGIALTDQLAGRQYIYSRSQNVAGIEIQRGSGGILYGSGALTGLVSFRTRGRTRSLGAHGSLGFFGNEGRVNTMASVGDEEIGAWVSVGGTYGSGDPRTIPYANVDGQLVERNRRIADYAPWRSQGIEGRAWAKDFEAFLQYASDTVDVTSGAEGAVLVNLAGNSVDNRQNIEQLSIGANYAPQLSDTVGLDINVHYRQALYSNDAVWQRSTAGTLIELKVDAEGAARWVGGNVQINAEPVDGVRIVAGGEIYRSVELAYTQQNAIWLPDESRYTRVPTSFGFKDAQSVYAVYANADIQPIDYFKLSAGLRVDKWFNRSFQLNPRLVAMAIPTKDDVLKVMVGRAFRAPVTFEQKYFVESISVPALELNPEAGWSFEAEYQHRMGPWTVLGSGWGGTYSNVIVSDLDPNAGGLRRYTNQEGGAVVYGVDAEIRREFSNGMMFSGWGSYQVPKVTDGDGNSIDAPEQPRMLGALKVVAPIYGPGLNAAMRITYEGRRPFRIDTLDGKSSDAVLVDLVMSGRTRDGVIGWRAGVYNALDVNFSAATVNSTESPVMPQTAGRTFMGSLEFTGRRKKDQL